jgi:hypothetical protein
MINIYFYSWLIGIPIVYYGFIKFFDSNNLYQKITVNNNKENLVVSQIVTSLGCVTYLSISGIILYNKYSNILFERDNIFKSNDDVINHIIIPMILYQGWNTVITYLNKDLYSIAYILHHLFVILLGIIGLQNYCQYYTIVYFGLLEISNIFLSIIEYGKYEKYIILNKILYNVNNLLFVFSFYILRIILFQYTNYLMFGSLLYERDKIFSNKYIVQTYIILISTLLLSYLQFHWGYKIYKEIINTVYKID